MTTPENKPVNVPTENAEQPATALTQQKKAPFMRPQNRISKKPPQPRKKTTTETPLVNDPLWKDSFILDGETGFVNEQAAKEFNADAAGFLHLINAEYKAISDVDKYYAKSIPSSAHAYYHQILYWYKLALIAQKRGTASHEQDRLVRFVQGYPSNVIAAGAGEYLEGLGDYEDHTGVKHLLRFTEPNNQGHFGRATAQTHGFYETLPAPAIFHQRVVEDVAASQRGNQADTTWISEAIVPQLHQNIVEPPPRPPQAARQAARNAAEAGQQDPDDEGGNEPLEDDEPAAEVEEVAILPTVNLLGWRPSALLSANQKAEMEAIIDPLHPNDGLIIQRYCLRRELFELVGRRLRECK